MCVPLPLVVPRRAPPDLAVLVDAPHPRAPFCALLAPTPLQRKGKCPCAVIMCVV
jgi:hypothetical protein